MLWNSPTDVTLCVISLSVANRLSSGLYQGFGTYLDESQQGGSHQFCKERLQLKMTIFGQVHVRTATNAVEHDKIGGNVSYAGFGMRRRAWPTGEASFADTQSRGSSQLLTCAPTRAAGKATMVLSSGLASRRFTIGHNIPSGPGRDR
jgi:hypothetical protein